ncbi:hypothetical protein Taro_016396 [Colocasia esculenta]|uniref:NOSIC domain-containing protein n=1 Tax=Colocasia esculenta TaxID=4460 RepID=A0A843UDP3_COLES|nr:hypothetical protein [Colocasia esculenta]
MVGGWSGCCAGEGGGFSIRGILNDELRNFLESSLPKGKEGKKAKYSLGVAEPKIGSQISELTKIPCQSNEFILELLCGVRLHFDRFIESLKPHDLEKAQLGLGHSYSRAKVKEWYSWHFPELVKIVNDNYLYAKIAKSVENKSELTEDNIPALADILGDEDKVKEVVEAAKASMDGSIRSGRDIVLQVTYPKTSIPLTLPMAPYTT